MTAKQGAVRLLRTKKKRNLLKRVATKPTAIPELDEKLKRMRILRAMRKEDDTELERLQLEVIALYRKHKLTDYDGVPLVEAERTILDAAELERMVGPHVWARITDRVVNVDKVEAAVERGLIPESVIKACTSFKPNKPYLRLGR